jgi:glycosyltransferase involved in cell wall biosynthesis
MDILLLAPHPFYQDRGTPVAVNLLLKVLSEREDKVDVVTYHEGREVQYDQVVIHRIPMIPWVRNVRPGFSWKKVICDLVMAAKVVSLVTKKPYQLVHAVEESVFIALVLKILFHTPYVYDMDSSLSQQVIAKHSQLALVAGFLGGFERLAVRYAAAVAPVCEALARGIRKYRPKKIVVLQDVSLLEHSGGEVPEDLRANLDISGSLLMYVGNLEVYQGIDLLLESFALVPQKTTQADLVIIGGEAADIKKYQQKSCDLAISHKVHFLGPRPVAYLGAFLSQADILVSPRIQGENTPMKLYSYLHSGKALLATNLPTHTQVLTSRVAMLADASPEAFAQAMQYLMEDRHIRSELGRAGKQLLEEQFSYAAFRKKVHELFDWLKTEIDPEAESVDSIPDQSSRVLH